METVTDIIFLGSKITADSDCSHEIKRCLLLGRKAMTNLDSVLKSRDITKVHLIKAVVFPVVMHGCESLTIKKAVVAVVVQSLSHVQLFVTSWTASHQASLSFTISQSLLKLMSIESAMPSNHLILCRPLLLLPSIFPSIRVFSKESVLHIRWPKYWSFSFSISPSNEHSQFPSGLTSLISLQSKAFYSLLQHHSSKATILQCSALYMVQLSHPCMTTGKTTAFTRWTFVSKAVVSAF